MVLSISILKRTDEGERDEDHKDVQPRPQKEVPGRPNGVKLLVSAGLAIAAVAQQRGVFVVVRHAVSGLEEVDM